MRPACTSPVSKCSEMRRNAAYGAEAVRARYAQPRPRARISATGATLRGAIAQSAWANVRGRRRTVSGTPPSLLSLRDRAQYSREFTNERERHDLGLDHHRHRGRPGHHRLLRQGSPVSLSRCCRMAHREGAQATAWVGLLDTKPAKAIPNPESKRTEILPFAAIAEVEAVSVELRHRPPGEGPSRSPRPDRWAASPVRKATHALGVVPLAERPRRRSKPIRRGSSSCLPRRRRRRLQDHHAVRGCRTLAFHGTRSAVKQASGKR
jgi:hypothetical protein